MDSDTEFPIPNYREREAIRHYLGIEHEFMATKDFSKSADKLYFRKHAVATIAKLSQGHVVDAYVAYLAMNYFDRFASTHPFLDSQSSSTIDIVCFVATSCFTLSSKMRTNQFKFHQFLAEKELSFQLDRLMRMEFRILSTLNWRMLSVTPFYFLDHYYPTFKKIGGFKRRSINEIIVQSQGEGHFIQFKPSDIAMCAFLAATFIGYPSRFYEFEKSIDKSGELVGCWSQLVQLCLKRDIEICSASGISLTKIAAKPPIQSGEAASAKVAEIQTTISEEELAELVESQVQKYNSTKATQFWNKALDAEEEEENVAPLTRRPRQDRDQRGKEVAEAETEAKELGQDRGKAVTVGDTSEEKEKDVEAENKGVGEIEEENKGVGEIEEICEEPVEAETELRLRKAKGKAKVEEETNKGRAKFISEIVPAADAAPKTLMNFDLRWQISVPPGEVAAYIEGIQHVEESRTRRFRCPASIRGSDEDESIKSRLCFCTLM